MLGQIPVCRDLGAAIIPGQQPGAYPHRITPRDDATTGGVFQTAEMAAVNPGEFVSDQGVAFRVADESASTGHVTFLSGNNARRRMEKKK